MGGNPQAIASGKPTRVARVGITPVPMGSCLPDDMVDRAALRLGWLAVFYALSSILIFVSQVWSNNLTILTPSGLTLVAASVVAATLLGILFSALAWSRRVCSGKILDLGLVFLVAGSFILTLPQYAAPIPPDDPIRGISPAALWLAFFILVVPTPLWKTIFAAAGAVLMAPLALLAVSVVMGNPLPQPGQFFMLFFPTVMVACFAIPLSRFIYSLGTQVSKAREMGSYELVERIGAGGMGEVWRGRHRMLARMAAVKLVRPQVLSEDPERAVSLQRRFGREAQVTAALRSPHTVALYDFGAAEDGSFYYAMELLDGVDLETLVKRYGPQPANRVISLLRQVCDSLSEAHEAGLVHRDIKPRNVFVCRLGHNHDFVKVLDFGLVRSEHHTEQSITLEGITTGTPAYMAPELATGEREPDHRADLYAVGCVAYWLLTGQLVFDHDKPMAMILAHVQTPPTPPSQRTELEIPAALEQVILRCLAKDPAERPQSAQELSALLHDCRVEPYWGRGDARRWWEKHLPAAQIAARTELETATTSGNRR